MSRDFWSRRRAAVEAEALNEKLAEDQASLARDHAELEEQSDEDILTALDLPDPDGLQHGDDFTQFMAKAVPDRIRRRALRALWKSNPVLANVDALVEYGEDYTDSATVIENLQTAYQVGKGMLQHVEEMARQAAAEDAEEALPAEIDDADAPVARSEEPGPFEDADAVTEVAEMQAAPINEPEPIAAPEITAMPRRMKFRIEETT